jgi:hypothetical protein
MNRQPEYTPLGIAVSPIQFPRHQYNSDLGGVAWMPTPQPWLDDAGWREAAQALTTVMPVATNEKWRTSWEGAYHMVTSYQTPSTVADMAADAALTGCVTYRQHDYYYEPNGLSQYAEELVLSTKRPGYSGGAMLEVAALLRLQADARRQYLTVCEGIDRQWQASEGTQSARGHAARYVSAMMRLLRQ